MTPAAPVCFVGGRLRRFAWLVVAAIKVVGWAPGPLTPPLLPGPVGRAGRAPMHP